MSNQVLSYGLMAPLLTPLTKSNTEQWEEVSARLAALEGNLELNYEGTLVFSNHQRKDPDDTCGIVFVKPVLHSMFFKALGLANLPITHEVQSYSCSWYNGSDSDMSMLTLEEFIKNSGQEV